MVFQGCNSNTRTPGEPSLLDKTPGQRFGVVCLLDFHGSVFLLPGFLREHAVPTIFPVIGEQIAKLSVALRSLQFACLDTLHVRLIYRNKRQNIVHVVYAPFVLMTFVAHCVGCVKLLYCDH